MAIGFPFYLHRPAVLGQTEDQAGQVRDLIEQVLFTSPGERVNRPDFGCGLLQLTFGTLGDALETTLQATVAGALQHWLGDVLQVIAVDVSARDSTLSVAVRYVDLQSQTQREERFER